MKSLSERKYRIAAEFKPQQAILLSWPHNIETWPTQLEGVRFTYCQIIREIADHEEVWINVCSEQQKIEVQRRLVLEGIATRNLRFFINPTFDAWVRDYGPISVTRTKNGVRERVFTSWQFNGWGGKYDDEYLNDSRVPMRVAGETKTGICEIDFVLEGGSIDVNGCGTLLTSTNCLLNANRNAGHTKNNIETVLKNNLGVTKIIWVDGEIQGDDTDGHIDDAARFVDEHTVVCIYEENENDPNYEAIRGIYKKLCHETDQDGRPLKVIKLPMPDPVYAPGRVTDAEPILRLPVSYANFLITNKKVLVPTYRCANDKIAIEILQSCFPTRKVVGIDGTDLVYGYGSVHCLSMHIPLA